MILVYASNEFLKCWSFGSYSNSISVSQSIFIFFVVLFFMQDASLHIPDKNRNPRWLRWLGFELEPARPLGPLGAPFHKATLKGNA